MSFKKLVVVFALYSLTAAISADAGETNVKYQDVFYPNGMPAKEGPLGSGQTAYEYYSETEIPESSLLIILYSERTHSEPNYSDYSHSAYLSIVRKTHQDMQIISTINVTDYMTNWIEECQGCFSVMDGSLNVFTVKDDSKILHLKIGSTISGTGGDSSWSDIFFLVDTVNNILVPVLTLLDTSTYARAGGMAEVSTDTFIYMLNDETSGTKILTQKYSYECDADENIHFSYLDPSINVYEYDFKNEKYEMTNTVSMLPKVAHALTNVHIKDPNECNPDK